MKRHCLTVLNDSCNMCNVDWSFSYFDIAATSLKHLCLTDLTDSCNMFILEIPLHTCMKHPCLTVLIGSCNMLALTDHFHSQI